MKRKGWVIEKIADMENLRLAFWKAKKGKSLSREVHDFMLPSLDFNLSNLRKDILDGNLKLGNYHFFSVFDPKERMVCAAPFAQRVLHHAIINICHDDFERYLIYDTYATRIGKGTYKALDRAMEFQKRYRYCLKLDIRKYFDSIDHEVLELMLARIYKDHRFLRLMRDIIDSYCTTPGKGLPIGNLTSQYFANHYLSSFDRVAKEEWRVNGYVRYMDDILIWSDSLRELKQIAIKSNEYLWQKLGLKLKFCQIRPSCQGLEFLGYKVSSKGLWLSRRSVSRYKKHLRELFYLYNSGKIDQKQMNMRLSPMIAFLDKSNSKGIKRQALDCCYR